MRKLILAASTALLTSGAALAADAETAPVAAVPAAEVAAAPGDVAAAAEAAADTVVETATETLAPADVVPPAPAVLATTGAYGLDKGHASLTWQVSHLGLSRYTAQFTDFDATLNFNAEDPTQSTVTATVNAASVDTDYALDYKAGHADSGYESWDDHLAKGETWFNAAVHPTITFTSTAVALTGATTGTVTGDLTFLGVTKPVTLDVELVGSMAEHPFQKVPAIGFSAKTTFKRSDFGFDTYVPNIGDEVTVMIEAEFHGKAAE